MKCIVCGEDSASPSDISGQKIFHCRFCGADFRKAGNIKKFYVESYFRKCYVGDEHDASRFRIAYRYLDELQSHKKTGKVLEIGCAGGHLLKACEIAGFDPVGIEISKFASDYARKKFKVKVINDDVENALKNLKKKTFDAVLMINLLENVRNPLLVMKDVNRVLKDDGVVILCVPNYSTIFKKQYPDLRTTFFKVMPLERMCRKAGFDIVSFRTRFLTYMADIFLQKVNGARKGGKEKHAHASIPEFRVSKAAKALDKIDKTLFGVSVHLVLRKAIA